MIQKSIERIPINTNTIKMSLLSEAKLPKKEYMIIDKHNSNSGIISLLKGDNFILCQMNHVLAMLYSRTVIAKAIAAPVTL